MIKILVNFNIAQKGDQEKEKIVSMVNKQKMHGVSACKSIKEIFIASTIFCCISGIKKDKEYLVMQDTFFSLLKYTMTSHQANNLSLCI